jgi:hypothetical protein
MYEPYILALSAEPPLLCPHNRGSSERAGLWRDHLSPALLDDSQLDKNIEYQPIRCRQNLGHSAVSRIYQQGGHWRVVDNRCGGDCFRFEAAEFPTTNVDGAVSALFDRIAAINRDSNSPVPHNPGCCVWRLRNWPSNNSLDTVSLSETRLRFVPGADGLQLPQLQITR